MLRPDLLVFWDAFQTLSPSRQVGMGLGTIPLSEIAVYMNELGLKGEERSDMLRFVRALDDEYITVLNEKEALKAKRSQAPRPPPA